MNTAATPGTLSLGVSNSYTGPTALNNSTLNFNSNNDSFAPDNVGSGTPRQIQFGLKLIF